MFISRKNISTKENEQRGPSFKLIQPGKNKK